MDGHDNQTENAFGRRRRPPEDSDPTRKRLDVAQKLTNDIAARIGEHAMTFNDVRPRGRYLTKPVCGDRVKINLRRLWQFDPIKLFGHGNVLLPKNRRFRAKFAGGSG